VWYFVDFCSLDLIKEVGMERRFREEQFFGDPQFVAEGNAPMIGFDEGDHHGDIAVSQSDLSSWHTDSFVAKKSKPSTEKEYAELIAALKVLSADGTEEAGKDAKEVPSGTDGTKEPKEEDNDSTKD